MPTTNPLVSVITPAFKAEPFIAETLRSVFAQTHRPLEAIVVDDCSPDGTAGVVESLRPEAEAAGVSLRLISLEKNGGASNALRVGFEAARAELLCWLSADDVWVGAEKLAQQVVVMQQTGAALSYYASYLAGPDVARTHPVTSPWMPRAAWLDSWVMGDSSRAFDANIFGGAVNGSSLMLTAAARDHIGGFDPTLGNVDPDGDLYLRLAAAGERFAAIPGAPLFYRIHEGQTSTDVRKMMFGTMSVRLRAIEALRRADRLGEVLCAGWPVFAERIAGRRLALSAGRAYQTESVLLFDAVAAGIRGQGAKAPLGARWVAGEMARLSATLRERDPGIGAFEAEVRQNVTRLCDSPVWLRYVEGLVNG